MLKGTFIEDCGGPGVVIQGEGSVGVVRESGIRNGEAQGIIACAGGFVSIKRSSVHGQLSAGDVSHTDPHPHSTMCRAVCRGFGIQMHRSCTVHIPDESLTFLQEAT